MSLIVTDAEVAWHEALFISLHGLGREGATRCQVFCLRTLHQNRHHFFPQH
jgi:hypothetical protein